MNIFKKVHILKCIKNSSRTYQLFSHNLILPKPFRTISCDVDTKKHSQFNLVLTRNIHCSLTRCDVKVIQTPTFAESVSEGDIRWSKAVGDSVEADEVIGEIETDKTAIPVHAPCSGVIEEIMVQDGDKVVANQDIMKIKEGKIESSKKEVKTETKPSSEPPKPSEPVSTPVMKTDKLIKEIKPPADMKLSQSMPSVQASGKAGIEYIGGTRGEQRVKMNRMRLRIAQRLKDAQNTCAMLTTFNECDMSSIISLRKQYQEPFLKKHGVKLGFMSAFVKAVAVALQDQPIVNAVIDGTDIIYRDYVDISVAVATPKGLLVPVLRDVQRMDFADIELGISELGEKARKGSLAVEDMDGGTFTISNGGVFGSLLGTPIINPPQSAILGIHATQQRPVAIDNQVVIRPMMYLALTYDHRLVDGREAVTFLRKIKSFIEDPRSVLLKL